MTYPNKPQLILLTNKLKCIKLYICLTEVHIFARYHTFKCYCHVRQINKRHQTNVWPTDNNVCSMQEK